MIELNWIDLNDSYIQLNVWGWGGPLPDGFRTG